MAQRSEALELALERYGKPDLSLEQPAKDSERERVNSLFPLDRWPSMPLERYALGLDSNHETFCYLMEYGTPDLGSIKGGSAKKHIIYWRRTEQKWWLAGPLQHLEPHQAWEALRAEFVRAFHAVEQGDLEQLDELTLLRNGPALVTKTLATYFPEKILPIYSADRLKQIIKAFGHDPIPHATTWRLTRQLADILDADPDFSGWTWMEAARFLITHVAPKSSSQPIIRIAPGRGARLWSECLEDGVIRIGWDDVPNLNGYPDEDELRTALAEIYPDKAESKRKWLATWLIRFRDLELGTRIVANHGTESVLAVGTVSGAYRYDTSYNEYHHAVGIDWDTSYAQRLDPPAGGWRQTFSYIQPEQWAQITSGRGHGDDTETDTVTESDDDVNLSAHVNRVLNSLKRKRQVIVFGPPGTGKTRLAFSAALAMQGMSAKIESPDRRDAINSLLSRSAYSAAPVTLTTFHPSYGYEDFIDGYKPAPAAREGGLVLKHEEGLFTRLCRDAAKAPDRSFVLIIDEINRADLPRVLGELLTVLEPDKRGHEVVLPVSGRTLSVPDNLYIIGTMNTADRSVAHLDAAVRRRFGFCPVPTDPTLLASEVGPLSLAAFLDALNTRIREHIDADHEVGHAYLLQDDIPIDDAETLHAAFYDDIVPLLEDYTFDEPRLLGTLLGDELVDTARLQVRMLDSEDLVAVLAKEFDAGVDTDAVSA